MSPSRAGQPCDHTLGAHAQPAPGVLVLNASRIRVFDDCPRQFFLRWVVGLEGEDTDDHGLAAAGREVHAELHARHREPEHHDDPSAVDPEGSSDPWVLARARAHGDLCPGPDAEYLGGEMDLRWLIVRKSILVTGRVDALWRHPDGTVEVRDYKTGGCPDDLSEERSAWLYVLLAASALPAKPSRVRVAFEALGGEEARVVTLEGTPEILRRAYDLVLGIAERIRAEQQFEAAPSIAKCGRCAFRTQCPHSALRELSATPTGPGWAGAVRGSWDGEITAAHPAL